MSPNAKNGDVIYTAKTHTEGGRDNGESQSADGRLDVTLATPGSRRIGTNPEQLLAAGWSACLASALALAARRNQIALGETEIDAEVDLHQDDSGYFLSVRFYISAPGVDRAVAQGLVKEAEQICPYCKATRGNIAVTIELV